MEGIDFDVVTMEEEALESQPIVSNKKKVSNKKTNSENVTYNPLRKEKVIVRHIPVERGIWGTNPKHIFAGGIASSAVKTFSVPRLASGQFVNVLTDQEKAYLEDALGLEYNAMSVYKKVDNFWSDANPNGINKVRLGKDDVYLDLSVPEDYIKYKILLANKDFVAPSLESYNDRKLATYQFILINEGSEDKLGKSKMSFTMECYKAYGKIEEDKDKLLTVIETLDNRPYADNTKIETLQNRCNEAIQKDPKMFLRVVRDEGLDTRVLIRKAVNKGILSKRGDFYYYRTANETTPLCSSNEEPTLSVAIRYLNLPKNQELLFSIQAKCKN